MSTEQLADFRFSCQSLYMVALRQCRSEVCQHRWGISQRPNSRVGLAYPLLRVLLDWLQKYQFEVQRYTVGSRQTSNATTSKLRCIDEDLWAAKLWYRVECIRSHFPWSVINMPVCKLYFYCQLQSLTHVSFLLGFHWCDKLTHFRFVCIYLMTYY